MKLIIPIEFYRRGGVERVIVSLIREFIELVDQVIIILPKQEISYFSKLFPISEKIFYESFSWSDSPLHLKALSALNKGIHLAKKLKLGSVEKAIIDITQKFNSQHRINYLIRKHKATHCLYLLINRLLPPKLNIPMASLAHDVFWRFAPLTYEASYIQEYDQNLQAWLEQSDLMITNSEKTKKDILSIFPMFEPKIKSIPLAGFDNDQTPSNADSPKPTCPIFYFPSSFGIYKDHLTLLKAVVQLVDKSYTFKVVLVGKETDGLLSENLSLSQQKKSKEYVDYLQQCRQVYSDYHNCLGQYVEGLGYCTYEQVERWYRECACVVVPSQYEGFGLAVAEAVVRGLPAIVSNLDVFREQVELYDCLDRVVFFPVGDASALSASMEAFLLNPKPPLSSQDIQSRFSHWTWRDVAKTYVNFLKVL
jgi:glycosyltransferase involved in cell wall biosynthesis